MVFYPFKLKSSKKFFLLVCALVLIIAFQNAGVPETKLIVHMAVNGSDTNSGLSANAPVKTLERVLQIVKVARANSDVPVTISFGSGVYFGQQLIWDSFSSIYPTVFEPASGELGDVIFDGRSDAAQTWGSKSYFLSFKHPRGVTAGQRTNVVINKLHIRYYYEILTFSGADRNNPATAISHNSVSNSKFEKIGSRWAVLSTSTASSYAMAGIRLVNSTHNKFTGNIFENIDNAEYEEIGGAYFPKQNSLDPSFPAAFRPAIADSLQEWNQSLRKSYFSNPRVEQNSIDQCISERKICFWWDGPAQVTIRGMSCQAQYGFDPSTGLILGGMITCWSPGNVKNFVSGVFNV